MKNADKKGNERKKYKRGEWLASLKAFCWETKRGLSEHRKGLIVFVSICFGFFLALSIATFKISDTSWFCGVCHNMDPYVASWKASSHRNVACSTCHYKPGFLNHLKGKWKDGQVSLVYFITGKVITKPHAEIADESCLRSGCHSRDQLADQLIYENVLFSHSRHLRQLRRDKQLRCTTCHSQIVQGTHITVTRENCFICHFYRGEKEEGEIEECGTCHFAPKGTILREGVEFNHQKYIDRKIHCTKCHTNTIKGTGSLTPNSCFQCHNKREILEATYSSQFMHENHVTNHKVECFYCHTAIEHKITTPLAKGIESEECGKCHGTHNEVMMFYRGEGGLGVDATPSKMARLKLDCDICHVKHARHESFLDVKNKCIDCHGDQGKELLEYWQKELKGRQKKVYDRLVSLEVQINTSPGDPSLKRRATRLLDKASYNYNLVRTARGVHNIVYAMNLLTAASNMEEEATSAIKEDYEPKYESYKISCSLCHQEGIMEKRVRFGKVEFPHDAHVEDESSCTNCHSSFEEHGKTFIRGCSQCHHQEEIGKVRCMDCHVEVASLYHGEGAIGVERKLNPTHLEVECKTCHLGVVEQGKETPKSILSQCLSCHEDKEEVSKTLEEWLDMENQTMNKLGKQIKALEKAMRTLEMRFKYINPFRKMFDDIERNYQLLRKGRALHNSRYGDAIRKNIEEKMAILTKMIENKEERKPIHLEAMERGGGE